MSIYYFQAREYDRHTKQPLMATIAYHAGVVLKDPTTKKRYGVGQKSRLLDATLLLPDPTPSHLNTRQKLWAAVDSSFPRQGCLALQLVMIMPDELSVEANWTIANRYAQHAFVRDHYAVDMVLERLSIGGNRHPRLRLFVPNGQIDDTDITVVDSLTSAKKLAFYRRRWIRYVNCELKRQGHKKMASPHPLMVDKLAVMTND